MLFPLRNYRTASLRLLLALLMMTLSRLLFGIFNPSTFSSGVISPFIAGLRYDLATICIFLTPFLLVHSYPSKLLFNPLAEKIAAFYFQFVIAFLVLLNLIDTAWFPFTGKRSTFDVFRMLATGNDTGNNLFAYVVDYWYLLILLVGFILVCRFLYKRTGEVQRRTFPPVPARIAIALVVVGLLFIGARGGLQMKPLSIQAAAGMTEPNSIPLALNTPYSLFKSIRDEVLPDQPYFSEQEALHYFSLHRTGTSPVNCNGKNVVVIILESFSSEYIGAFNNGKGYTPFLDSLIHQSTVWSNAFANGKRSIEGIPAVVASIPALMNEPFITSAWNASSINSLASLLQPLHYHSAFFHGGNNGTMGFDDFAKLAGYNAYYGRNEYDGASSDYDGHWGIFDDSFFQFLIRKANTERGSFHYTLFSLSSHHPYTIPEALKGKFKEGPLPIEKSIGYTDFSLQHFFAEASKCAWFKNTIFIITADHTGPSEGGYYANKMGMYAIPIIIYQPGVEPKEYKQTAQQCDILPTALHLLHYTGNYSAFGTDLYDRSRSAFAVNYANNNWQLITDSSLLQFDGNTTQGYFKLAADSLLSNNLAQKNHSLKEEKQLKSVLQQYRQALLHNSLIKR